MREVRMKNGTNTNKKTLKSTIYDGRCHLEENCVERKFP